MKVLDVGSWSFDNKMLILHRIGQGDVPATVPLFHVNMGSVYFLPVGLMKEVIGKEIVNFIGAFLEYDWRNV